MKTGNILFIFTIIIFTNHFLLGQTHGTNHVRKQTPNLPPASPSRLAPDSFGCIPPSVLPTHRNAIDDQKNHPAI